MTNTATARDVLARSIGWPSDAAIQTTLNQIGRTTVLAVSGGRVVHGSDACLLLPVQYGHAVEVRLEANDTYTVMHTFRRGLSRWVKGQWDNVHAENLSEVVYTASCWRDR
jgi:hypothetical protein